jgi:hypothetical protein
MELTSTDSDVDDKCEKSKTSFGALNKLIDDEIKKFNIGKQVQ